MRLMFFFIGFEMQCLSYHYDYIAEIEGSEGSDWLELHRWQI